MLGLRVPGGVDVDRIATIEDWVRRRFDLGDDAVVSVSEMQCGLPGCPPLETVILFWEGTAETRYRLKLFKPITEVVEADLPVSWLKRTLIDTGDLDCC